MGLIGLFVGPVLMALIVAIWREWVLEANLAAAEKPAEAEPPPAQSPTAVSQD